MRRWYVTGVRGVASALRAIGLVSPQRTPHTRVGMWMRSLLAIYDIDDMVHLDLPWWNLRAAARVEAHLAGLASPRVFEYGSGASTVWLARRAASVISVEHDPSWADVVRRHIGTGVDLRLVEPDRDFDPEFASERRDSAHLSFRDYVGAIDRETQPFDLIVIDGRARAQCLTRAIPHLAPGGMIVFDDTRRERYRRAIAASGLVEQREMGLSACVPYPDATSLLTV